ncbi:MAG: Rho termination factor N-terminal domain-containing protein, partial [Pedosphaera parvula]|nr:Rho termination factor N-terminal domain-containing protein [Pedosphaera parvula]
MSRVTKKPAKPKSAAKGKSKAAQPAPEGQQELPVSEMTSDTEAVAAAKPPVVAVDEDVTEKPAAGEKGEPATATTAAASPASTLNIVALQAMSIGDLNKMAKEMGIENFGTMRKHEVIFHILQKNAERSGVLFAEGVLEILPEGFGFLRSQSFNYLP